MPPQKLALPQVRRSIVYFLFGKAFSSLAGFVALMLLVRNLTVKEFAAYSVLIGSVDFLAALSAIGLNHAIVRYVPELYVHHYRIALRSLVSYALTLRAILLVGVAFVLLWLGGLVTDFFGLSGSESAFAAFLVVGCTRSMLMSVSQFFESILNQGISQLGYSISSVTRMFGMLYLAQGTAFTLIDAIHVEIVSDALGLLFMLAGLVRELYLGSAEPPPADDADWLTANWRRIIGYSMAGYLQHLTILFAGGNTNRMLGGHYAATLDMAEFGFAQSLYEFVKRYLPSQLFIGIIRPVVLIRFIQTGNYSSSVKILENVFKINALFIGLALAFVSVFGKDFLEFLTSGKYGSESVRLLLVLTCVLFYETMRQQLEVLVQVAERYGYLIYANLLLSLSIVPGIWMLPHFGMIALPIANLAGLVVSNYWVAWMLKKHGCQYVHEWASLFLIAAVILSSALIGWWAGAVTGRWWLGGVALSASFVLLTFVVMGRDIKRLYSFLTGND